MPRGQIVGLLVFLMISGASSARAEGEVILMVAAERRAVFGEALRLELGGKGLVVTDMDAPSGEVPLERSAAAQREVRFAGAQAAIWVEQAPAPGGASVRAVGPQDETIRHAPLPSALSDIEPRTFAAVAASLLAELERPESGPAPVNVHVEVHLDSNSVAPPDATAPPTVLIAPADAAATPAAPTESATASPVFMVASPEVAYDVGYEDDGPLMPREGVYLDAGISTAIIFNGVAVEIGTYISDTLRIGPQIIVGGIMEGNVLAGMTGLSLTRVGRSRSGRFDFGANAGMVFAEVERFSYPSCDPTWDPISGSWIEEACPSVERSTDMALGWSLGGFLGWAWELSEGFGVGARLAVNLAQVDGGDVLPWPILTIFSELPL